MIRLSEPRHQRVENIVPMINVAFLLLIFFLMTAVIAPLDPVRIDPPEADGSAEAAGDVVLFVEREGTLWRDGQRRTSLGPLSGLSVELRVARDLDGAILARVLADAQQAGAITVQLVVARPRE
ncbi:Biopolymer transport protein ExbD/TolR [Boseongicola aestuarii]|uniref:Biopolymer transport protein ExbD/TolR n=1 Tax=Boseongicola aestuarii TaxID=1470561 RepID=A0A238J0I0_9RHOB|nr:biopolymer transporter ExbD [Boseongicola aestuarii]SMX24218.1 Biopolymer transport protein ExbD/TolR [Boseongicola aestuarii]